MRIDKLKQGHFISVTKLEALDIINSLSSQLRSGSGDTGRVESWDENGEYFSIGVEFIKGEKEI